MCSLVPILPSERLCPWHIQLCWKAAVLTAVPPVPRPDTAMAVNAYRADCPAAPPVH